MICRTLVSMTFCSIVALSGCATIFGPHNAASWPWDSKTPPCKASGCDANDALLAYTAASKFCRDVQNYYESGGQRANTDRAAIGIVGTVAGAVIAPIAKGNASHAWAGLSGAANGLQVTFDEAVSSTVDTRRRSAVLDAATKGDADYRLAGDPIKEVTAAVHMAAACAMSSATADQQTLNALAALPPPAQGQKSAPTVTIAVISKGAFGKFDYTLTGLSDTTDSVTTTKSDVLVTSSKTSTGTAGTAVTIVQTATASFNPDYSCTDSKGVAGSVNGNGGTVSLTGSNMLAGAAYTCTFTETKH